MNSVQNVKKMYNSAIDRWNEFNRIIYEFIIYPPNIKKMYRNMIDYLIIFCCDRKEYILPLVPIYLYITDLIYGSKDKRSKEWEVLSMEKNVMTLSLKDGEEKITIKVNVIPSKNFMKDSIYYLGNYYEQGEGIIENKKIEYPELDFD